MGYVGCPCDVGLGSGAALSFWSSVSEGFSRSNQLRAFRPSGDASGIWAGVSACVKGEPLDASEHTPGPGVIGIDAAVVAAHQVAVRGEVREDFKVRSTLAGFSELTDRLEPMRGRWWLPNPPLGLGFRWLTP